MNSTLPQTNERERKNPTRGNDHEEREGFVSEIVRFTLISIAIILPIRTFIAQPFIVSGSSMYPTFESGEYLIVDQLSYRLHQPERGDVVIFRYPRNPSEFFIKRIVGLPGETVDVGPNGVFITAPDSDTTTKLDESYLSVLPSRDHFEQALGADEYFVMGDNRDKSSDSRYWGALPSDNIVGRAWLRLFPFNRVNLLPGKENE